MKATAAVRLVTLSLLLMPVVLEGQPAGSLRSVNVQILGISANHFFSQKTFVESLKLPYPLLSDFPDLRVIRCYGVLSASETYAKRAFSWWINRESSGSGGSPTGAKTSSFRVSRS
jgi:AhpC/TSA family